MTCRHKDKYNNPDCSSYIPASVEGWRDAIDYAHKKAATR